MAQGNQGHVGLCFQQSMGTEYTSSMHYLPILTESMLETKPRLASEAIRSRFEAGPKYEGLNEVGGELSSEVHPILIGMALKAWCGQASGSIGTSEYTHTFLPLQSDFDSKAAVPPMTVEVYRDTGSGMLYYDQCLNNFDLEIANGELLKMTWGFIGCAAKKATKTTPSYLTGDEFRWNQVSVSLGGSALDEISQLTISGNLNLEAKGYLNGNTTPARVLRTDKRTLEISGTVVLDGDTQKDIARAQTSQRMVVTVTGQEVSSGYNAKLEVDIPSFVYTEYPDNIGGPGLIEVSFKGEADYNTGSATMVEFTLVNTQSIY